ncbi:MAG TPA: CDP-alcohol phosphatidyltransferase family protein [Actinomycetota bacterium]
MDGGSGRVDGDTRILTVPNVLSFVRIAAIPVFVMLLLDEGTRLWGFLVLGVVQGTDWVDGYVARRYRQVTELGKVLDPLADRLAVGAALITFVVADLFPLWAALLVLVRDGLVLVAVGVLALLGAPRIEVRRIGKVATFVLMWAIPMIAWGNAGFLLDDVVLVHGWIWFGVGYLEYLVATGAYVVDVRGALRARPPTLGG